MGALIHILLFNDEECTSHVIPFEAIERIKCRYPAPPTPGVNSNKTPTLEICDTTGVKVQMNICKKTTFRIVDEAGPVFEDTSLQRFEAALIELIQGSGVYQPGSRSQSANIGSDTPSA